MFGGLLTYASEQLQGSVGNILLATPASEVEEDMLAEAHNGYRTHNLWGCIPGVSVLGVQVGLSLAFFALTLMGFSSLKSYVYLSIYFLSLVRRCSL